VPYVLESLMGLRNVRHMPEWSTSFEDGILSCYMKYITLSLLSISQFLGEHSVNHGWLCCGEYVMWSWPLHNICWDCSDFRLRKEQEEEED